MSEWVQILLTLLVLSTPILALSGYYFVHDRRHPEDREDVDSTWGYYDEQYDAAYWAHR